MTSPRPTKSQGQWALGEREPLNPNEQFKRDDDAPPTRCGSGCGGQRSLDHCATDVAGHSYQGRISLIVIESTDRA